MRKQIVCLCLIIFSSALNAQELWTKKEVNRDDKLIHHATFYTSDHVEATTYTALFTAIVAEQKLSLNLFDSITDYPDVAFIAADYMRLYDEAISKHIMPVFIAIGEEQAPKIAGVTVIKASSLKQAAKRSVKLLKKLYYTGMRPCYSTIFTNGEEGYVSYRIPSIATLSNGRILAFAETRAKFASDCAENNIVMKYSDDNGLSWSKLSIVADAGLASLNNPTTIYIKETNEVIVIYQEYPPKTNESIAVGGFEENAIKIKMVRSADNGDTWSEAIDISRQTKQPTVLSQATGPGIGIRVVAGANKGRILVPINAVGGPDGWYNYLIYSDNLGKNWEIIEGKSQYGTNESQLVQIGADEFLINARCHRFIGDENLAPKGWNPWNFGQVTRYRGDIKISIDGTKGRWDKTRVRTDMPDPLCQGGLIRYSGLENREPSILLFTNPASNLTDKHTQRPYANTPPMRMNGSIALSSDEGESWSVRKRFYGNRYTEYQYSVPARLEDKKVGVIFEANNHIKFAAFDLKWIQSNGVK